MAHGARSANAPDQAFGPAAPRPVRPHRKRSHVFEQWWPEPMGFPRGRQLRWGRRQRATAASWWRRSMGIRWTRGTVRRATRRARRPGAAARPRPADRRAPGLYPLATRRWRAARTFLGWSWARPARPRRRGALAGQRHLSRAAGRAGGGAAIWRVQPGDAARAQLSYALAHRTCSDPRRYADQPHRDRLPLAPSRP